MERQAKLRREVLAVNDDHIRRLTVALKTKGRATAAVLAMVTTCTLTRAKFDEAIAAAVASGMQHFHELFSPASVVNVLFHRHVT